MKIVLIAPTIYPKTAPRALRATELAKQFAKEGHDVTLYAILGKYDYTDFQKSTNIKIKNLTKSSFFDYNSDIGRKKINFVNRVIIRLFYNILEWPDILLVTKITNILKREENIDLLITIAIPYPIHWGTAIAKKKLKEKFPKTWISDCGDPYMGNSVGKKPPFYFKYFEKFWGRSTDFITIPIEEARCAYYDDVQNKIRIVPQGFDFKAINVEGLYRRNKIPHFIYSGAIYIGDRDPFSFLDYLSTLDSNFVFTIYTSTPLIFTKYKKLLNDKLSIKEYIPREQLLVELAKSDFLINLTNKSNVQSPSKLIDYALSQRPVLDISVEFDNVETFNNFLLGNYDGAHILNNFDDYNIINVANKFLNLK